MRLEIKTKKTSRFKSKTFFGSVFLILIFTSLISASAVSAAGGAYPVGFVAEQEARRACETANAANGTNRDCAAEGAAARQQAEQAAADARNSPGITGGGVGYALAQVVYVFTVGLGSAVAYVGANILNFAVHMSLDSAAYALDFVSSGWTTARDVANMAFIFILIYIAMTVMFQAQVAGTMQTLAKVIIVALLINFSFFITRVVIDAGNILSIQFYNAVVATTQNNPQSINALAPLDTGVQVPDITANIMQGINFTEAFTPETFAKTHNSGFLEGLEDFGTTFIAFSFIYIALGAMLFILAAAFVAAGIKFIIRIVMLWFAIITSPLAFVAWSFQGGGGHGGGQQGGHGTNWFKKWRDNLVAHAFYPAAFLFIFLIISNFMGATGNAGLEAGFVQQALNTGTTGNQNVLVSIGGLIANMAVRLGFVIVMLYFALKASDYIGVAGASFAKNIGNRFSFGTGGFVSRLAGGGAARLASNALPDNRIGRIAKAPLNLVARSSFDMRAPLSKVGLEKEFGKPTGKGGFDAMVRDLRHRVHDLGSGVKKEGEERAKEFAEHGGGPKAEARAQAEFRRNFPGGAAAFDARVKDLAHELAEFRKEAVELQKRILETTDEGQKAQHTRDLQFKQTQIKNTEKELRAMASVGKMTVEALKKPHQQEVAVRLASSGNTVKYIVGNKALTGKDAAAKMKEAAKEAAEEDKAQDHPPTNGKPASSPTIEGKATEVHKPEHH